MFFFISKILSFIISPLFWIFTLILIGVTSKKPKRKKRFIITSLIVLYFFSNSFIVDEVFRIYEKRDNTFEQVTEKYDVAIILGGFLTYDEQQNLVGFHESSDRFLQALKLYKTHKVKKLMIVGGSGRISRPDEKEGPILANYLMDIGIPERDIIIESESKNTRQNAVNTARILNEQFPDGKFILFTSGYHMFRSVKCFEEAGMKVTPFSVDHRVGKRKFDLDHLFIPNLGALINWEILFHEWLGVISYYLMGYI